MTPSVAELLGYPVTVVCICGSLVRDVAYGFPLSEDNDEPIAWIDEWHDHCLGEWGWRRDDSEWGITHRYCEEPIEEDEDIRPS